MCSSLSDALARIKSSEKEAPPIFFGVPDQRLLRNVGSYMVYEDTLYRYANYERTHCSGHERMPLHDVFPYITYLQNKSKDQSRKQIKKQIKNIHYSFMFSIYCFVSLL